MENWLICTVRVAGCPLLQFIELSKQSGFKEAKRLLNELGEGGKNRGRGGSSGRRKTEEVTGSSLRVLFLSDRKLWQKAVLEESQSHFVPGILLINVA